MTNFDLRLSYKKDTGNSADANIIKEIVLDESTTISELVEFMDIEIDIEMDEIPYVLWLEEQLIKLKIS